MWVRRYCYCIEPMNDTLSPHIDVTLYSSDVLPMHENHDRYSFPQIDVSVTPRIVSHMEELL